MSGRARRAAVWRLASLRLPAAIAAAGLAFAVGAPNAVATPLSGYFEDEEATLVTAWPPGVADPAVDGYSYAMIVKPQQDNYSDSLFADVDENGAPTVFADVSQNDDAGFWYRGMRGGSGDALAPDHWHLVAVTVEEHENALTYVKDLDTDTWISTGVANDFQFCCSDPVDLAGIVYGSSSGAGAGLAEGSILIAAQWDEALSAGAIEDLGDDLALSTWMETARSDMLVGHRFSTTSLNDFSGRGAAEQSRSGVTLVADAPTGWIDDVALPCPSDPFAAAQSSAASTVYDWNEVLLDAFREGGPPTSLSRAAAMMNVGIYDTFNSVFFAQLRDLSTGTPTTETCGWEPFEVLADTPASTDADLAAGIAARDILNELFPGFTTEIGTAFTGMYGSGPYQSAAEDLGEYVADEVIASRASDGSTASMPYTPASSTPGAWRPTPTTSLVAGCSSAVAPGWGNVTPFTLSSASQFRQALPGGYSTYASLLASPYYAAQVQEVQDYGGMTSSVRTSDQEQAAWFWANDLDGTYKPPGQLLEHTRIVAETQPAAQASGAPGDFFGQWSQQGIRVARLYAAVSLAMADSAIAAWDQKYLTAIDLWRPYSAITLAGTDGNAATIADAGWEPLSSDITGASFSPCFPAWVSGHATFAGAWSRTMENEFENVDHDDPFPITLTSEDLHAVLTSHTARQFDSFADAGEENGASRIWLGVHYRVDMEDGLATGRGVADHVTSTALLSDQACEDWDCGEAIPPAP